MKSTIFKTMTVLGIFLATKIFSCNVGNKCTKGLKSLGDPLRTIKGIGLQRCGKICASIGGCKSFSFHQNNLTCILTDSTDSVAASDGWRFCADLQCAKEKLGACTNKSLSPGSQCFELSSGEVKILTSVCMEMPTVTNGTVTIEDRAVGSKALLSCAPNYISKGEPYVICKTDGTWTNMNFSCSDCGGPPPPIENMTMSEGSWLVESEIEYYCPAKMGAEGTTSVTCLNDGTWSSVSPVCIPFDWPQGKFTLLQPDSGCPTHFESGYISFPLESNSTESEINHVKGSVTNTSVLWHFCTNTVISHVVYWPMGDYCILKAQGNCPKGFNKPHLHIYTTHQSTMAGTVLSHYSYVTETLIYLCCRSDGDVNTPIDLPTTNSFFLFRNVAFDCQKVNGMNSTLEDTLFDDKVNGTRIYYHNDNTGLVKYDRSTFTIHLFYCYYSPISVPGIPDR